jgi:predicted HicB family RNase H-like nuclease
MVPLQITFNCGPYKGYFGRAEWDNEVNLFHGDVTGTRDAITFVGKTPAELATEFVNSVEDYLAMCAESGKQPEKPFSGRFVVRIKPEVHRKLSAIAEHSKSSLNQLISDVLEGVADGMPAGQLRGHEPMSLGKKPGVRSTATVGKRKGPQA